ncbi:cilia- and flagella-associated protein 90 [Pogoniulus pusillus]|uniref:cilia- and flagella-associated protein 90 n=1 Tax=Pogoniulus pusillus TaxID=488313 RepID=UPI0030B9A36A
MASVASDAAPGAPRVPGLGESEGTEEALGTAAGRRQWPPLAALSAFSHVPARREGPPELSYFHRRAQAGGGSTYDAIFRRPEGYNKHLHRCDREHAKSHGLNINEEETARPVAVLSSSEYGRRVNKPIEQPVRGHARINHLRSEFYRKNGVTCLLQETSPSLDPC